MIHSATLAGMKEVDSRELGIGSRVGLASSGLLYWLGRIPNHSIKTPPFDNIFTHHPQMPADGSYRSGSGVRFWHKIAIKGQASKRYLRENTYLIDIHLLLKAKLSGKPIELLRLCKPYISDLRGKHPGRLGSEQVKETIEIIRLCAVDRVEHQVLNPQLVIALLKAFVMDDHRGRLVFVFGGSESN